MIPKSKQRQKATATPGSIALQVCYHITYLFRKGTAKMMVETDRTRRREAATKECRMVRKKLPSAVRKGGAQ